MDLNVSEMEKRACVPVHFSHMRKLLQSLLVLIPLGAVAGNPEGLVYSGRTRWDSVTGILVFESSGSMPDSKEGFHWTVPDRVQKILIGEGSG